VRREKNRGCKGGRHLTSRPFIGCRALRAIQRGQEELEGQHRLSNNRGKNGRARKGKKTLVRGLKKEVQIWGTGSFILKEI